MVGLSAADTSSTRLVLRLKRARHYEQEPHVVQQDYVQEVTQSQGDPGEGWRVAQEAYVASVKRLCLERRRAEQVSGSISTAADPATPPTHVGGSQSSGQPSATFASQPHPDLIPATLPPKSQRLPLPLVTPVPTFRPTLRTKNVRHHRGDKARRTNAKAKAKETKQLSQTRPQLLHPQRTSAPNLVLEIEYRFQQATLTHFLPTEYLLGLLVYLEDRAEGPRRMVNSLVSLVEHILSSLPSLQYGRGLDHVDQADALFLRTVRQCFHGGELDAVFGSKRAAFRDAGQKMRIYCAAYEQRRGQLTKNGGGRKKQELRWPAFFQQTRYYLRYAGPEDY